MPEITTPQTTETAPAPAQTTPRPPVKPNGGRKKKKMVKNLIILAVVLALLAAGGFALYRFLFSTGGEEGEIFSQPAFLGSIQQGVRQRHRQGQGDRRHHPQRRRHRTGGAHRSRTNRHGGPAPLPHLQPGR